MVKESAMNSPNLKKTGLVILIFLSAFLFVSFPAYCDDAQILSRYIFYNNSFFDGNNPGANDQDDDAIAPDKQPLLPNQTGSFINYTSYEPGINGIMVDIEGLGDPAGLTLANLDQYFEFRTGNENNLENWTVASPPTSVAVRQANGMTANQRRITLIWEGNAVRGKWLQVKMLANSYTGLSENDTFYFGNAPGETGNSTTEAKVNAVDMLGTRDNPRNALNPAPIDFRYDHNRDAIVDIDDVNIARDNPTNFRTALKLIELPNEPPTAVDDPSIETDEDIAVDIYVLANDLDPDTPNTNLEILDATLPEYGSINFRDLPNPDDNFKYVIYTPPTDWHGTTTFTYYVSDGENQSTNEATVTVTVNSVNDPPVAVNDSATVTASQTIAIDVLANDSDPENSPLTVRDIADGPDYGSAEIKNNQIYYTAPISGATTDNLEYEINDDGGATAIGRVSITITPGERYYINVTVAPTEGGSVVLDPPDDGTGYPRDMNVTVIATPDPGYGFFVWTGRDAPPGGYAEEREIVVIMQSDKELTANFVLYGDIHENGDLNSEDASLAAQHAVGLINLTGRDFFVGNVDGDSDIDSEDASLIAQHVVGLISEFPVER